ncbi:MAG: RNA-guided pseudouridylation complex pseudouridine synthase subunit Cbf5, partial [Candidatus Woesearchaeota archaeon]
MLVHKILVRKESETDDRFGSYPEKRSVEKLLDYGIVNINKPRGPSSHEVSAHVQKILGINKSGHSGTLDPNVTGCLPIALGRATRIVQVLLPAGKEYVALMHLHNGVDEKQLRKTLQQFIGEITQLPPIKSAVKRQERKRKIYSLDVLETKGQDVMFRVSCQAGTYVRKLCHDIGQKLGVGAHMAELVRTRAGPFDETTMVSLLDLADAYHYYKEEKNDKYLRNIVKPVEHTVQHMPRIWVFDSTVEPLCHGTDLAAPGISKLTDGIQKEDIVAVLSLKGELVALGKARMNSSEMMGDRGMAVKIHKVFMEPGTYP